VQAAQLAGDDRDLTARVHRPSSLLQVGHNSFEFLCLKLHCFNEFFEHIANGLVSNHLSPRGFCHEFRLGFFDPHSRALTRQKKRSVAFVSEEQLTVPRRRRGHCLTMTHNEGQLLQCCFLGRSKFAQQSNDFLVFDCLERL
jgi:hypothetical protein